MSYYIRDRLKREVNDPVVLVPCSSCRRESTRPAFVLRMVISQIISQISADDPRWVPAFDVRRDHREISDASFDLLLDLLTRVLNEINCVYLVIDGLDECDMNDTEMDLLLQWLCSSTLDPLSNLKIMLISRDVADIRARLSSTPSLEMDRLCTQKDIVLFTKARLPIIGPVDQSRDEIITTITESCEGVFLWADIVLRGLKYAGTPNEVVKMLKESKGGLEVLYESIMTRFDSSSDGLFILRKKIFTILACARQSLGWRQLEEFVAVEAGAHTIDPGNKLRHGLSTIILACSPMLQIRDSDRVEFIHHSAKEFVLKKKTLCRSPSLPWSEEDAHAWVASVCLTYLCLQPLQKSLPGDAGGDRKTAMDYPFLGYASLNWWYHLLKSGQISPANFDLFDQFLRSISGITWVVSYFPYFRRLQGEHLSAMIGDLQVIAAELKAYLRLFCQSINEERKESTLKQLDGFVLTSFEKAINFEKHSNDIEKTPRRIVERMLDLCKAYFYYSDAPKCIEKATKALAISEHNFGLHDSLTLRLQRIQLLAELDIGLKTPGSSLTTFPAKFATLASAHRAIIGPFDHDTLQCQHDVCLAHFQSSDWDSVITILSPVHKLMELHLGRNSRTTQRTANNIAIAAYLLNQADYAESILLSIPELSNLLSKRLATSSLSLHPYTVDSLAFYGTVCSLKDRFTEAEKAYRIAINGLEKVKGYENPRIYEFVLNLGLVYQEQLHFKKALNLYEEWIHRCEDALGENSASMQRFETRLVELEETWKLHKERGVLHGANDIELTREMRVKLGMLEPARPKFVAWSRIEYLQMSVLVSVAVVLYVFFMGWSLI
jgi:tetratricopeptide (TPR) repeat protein